MAVRDKELIINGKAVRSPEQQVYQNMKDIEELQEVIKPEYKCTTELSTSATSVAKSYTNAGEDVDSGWLLDPVGKKFKITGGDEDSLLIVFYTSYQGQQGEPGQDGVSAINDNSVSLEKVWSSQKVFNEFARAKDKGVYITSTEPTLSDGVYTLVGNTDITNRNTDVPIKANDLIIYIDGDDKVKIIYKVLTNTGVGQNLTLSKEADFGGGKQLYRHEIQIYATSPSYRIMFTIINERSEKYTTTEQICNYLYEKLGAVQKWITASGLVNYNSTTCPVFAVSVDSDYPTYKRLNARYGYTVNSQTTINYAAQVIYADDESSTINDNVIAL